MSDIFGKRRLYSRTISFMRLPRVRLLSMRAQELASRAARWPSPLCRASIDARALLAEILHERQISRPRASESFRLTSATLVGGRAQRPHAARLATHSGEADGRRPWLPPHAHRPRAAIEAILGRRSTSDDAARARRAISCALIARRWLSRQRPRMTGRRRHAYHASPRCLPYGHMIAASRLRRDTRPARCHYRNARAEVRGSATLIWPRE